MEQLKCPSTEAWDIFLLTAAESRQSELAEHLITCETCQVIVRWRRELLDGLAIATHKAARLSQIICDFRPVREHLHNGFRLAAAQSGATAVPRSVSMVSPDETLLVKIVEDEQTSESWLYVIADDASLFRNVLVRPFGDNREFLTDDNGRAHLGKVAVASIDPSKAEISLPAAVFKLTPLAKEGGSIAESTLKSEFGDEIRILMADTSAGRNVTVEIVKLSNRIADRPIRIAVRDPRTGRARLVSPSESFPDTTTEPVSVDLYIFQ